MGKREDGGNSGKDVECACRTDGEGGALNSVEEGNSKGKKTDSDKLGNFTNVSPSSELPQTAKPGQLFRQRAPKGSFRREGSNSGRRVKQQRRRFLCSIERCCFLSNNNELCQTIISSLSRWNSNNRAGERPARHHTRTRRQRRWRGRSSSSGAGVDAV
jgi:hypothetical protein